MPMPPEQDSLVMAFTAWYESKSAIEGGFQDWDDASKVQYFDWLMGMIDSARVCICKIPSMWF